MRHTSIGLTVVIALGALAHAQPAQPPTVDSVLRQMHAFLASYEPELTALIAEERYEQRTITYMGRTRMARDTQAVRLESDMAFVRLPGNAAWFGFRDVRKVNGKDVNGAGVRLRDLLASSATFLEQAQAITLASSRHNLGSVRTINMPTVPLEVLAAGHRKRFAWRLGPRATIRGARTIQLIFDEVVSPTMVQLPEGGDVISYGTVQVELGAGRVWRVALSWRDPKQSVTGLSSSRSGMQVEFELDKRLELMVPVQLNEMFSVTNGTGAGSATYRNFRRYQTSARIVQEP